MSDFTVPAPLIEGEPGYCDCCREYHLLNRRDVPPLTVPPAICRFCEALGAGELAWRLAGVTDGEPAEYRPRTRREAREIRRGQRRWRRENLAEWLVSDEPRYGSDFAGFSPRRYSPVTRLRIAWRARRGGMTGS